MNRGQEPALDWDLCLVEIDSDEGHFQRIRVGMRLMLALRR